jgi:exonuclease SbcC
MTYFDRIIARANVRLMKMTDGLYELKRSSERDGRTKIGLDLNVIDHGTATERNINSLSGGEQFKAALALALGQADEIQSRSGGIRLDTMFIDEGFGSLDSTSLELAMQALADLTEGNKLVGIISHVDGLKSRIDKQIVIKKNRYSGSEIQVIA